MLNIREKIERSTVAYSNFVFQYAKWVLLLSLSVFAFFAVCISQLKMDFSVEGSLHKTDPLRIEFREFQNQFGRDDLIVVGLDASLPLSNKQLSTLKKLQEELEKSVPFLDKVDSLHNVRLIYGLDDVLHVDELLDNWPYGGVEQSTELAGIDEESIENKNQKHLIQPKPQDLKTLSRLVTRHKHYANNLIAKDGSMLVMTIELSAEIEGEDGQWHNASQEDNRKAIESINAVLQNYQELKPKLAGSAVTVAAFNQYTMDDTALQSTLAALAIIMMLAIFFRRSSGVVIPLLIVQFSVVSVLGFMAFVGAPMKSITSAVIVLLYAVAASDAVHVLTHFYQQLEAHKNKRRAIAYAMSYSAPAILLTSITTAAGFLSFAFAELSIIAEMGIYSAVGVAFALFYTFTFLPATLVLFNFNTNIKATKVSKNTEAVLSLCVGLATRYPKAIVSVFLIVAAIACLQIPRLQFSDDTVSYFPDESPVKLDLFAIDEALDGSASVEVIIDSGETNGLYNPIFLNAIDEAVARIESQRIAGITLGKAYSINDIVKEINQSLNNNDARFYRIPDNRKLIAQEILLFQNSGTNDLERVSDQDLRLARITIKLPYADGVLYKDLITQLQRIFDEVFIHKPASSVNVSQERALAKRVTITGTTALLAGCLPRALESMSVSYVMAFVVISFFMVLMAGNFTVGLISMIPNVLPIIFGLGGMGLLGINLDVTSIMVGCIALGIVVDDTLHFIYHYTKNYQQTGSANQAIDKTLHGAGRAMLITTCVLVGCFASDLVATMSNVFVFGTVVASIISMALVTDLLLAPALMMLLHGDKETSRVLQAEVRFEEADVESKAEREVEVEEA